ncbi:hypothetical protein BJV82DRAFT_575349 [Fennellomyces sp. T-0311]|nr:hypothetical protein BJV82DRAFT_575349 [Fennellomyces sp. T-0311]
MHFINSLTILASSLISLHLFTAPVAALNVTSISDCPALAPRNSTPTDVTDVRIDDIKVIAAMGDSIMAGFGMMGSGSGLDSMTEYRGQSYGIGGDANALTVATFTKQFSPDLVGPSTGERLVSLCAGGFCSPTFTYRTNDRLNAAVSGSTAKYLDSQLTYIISKMKSLADDYENDWKLINIQIGSNDQCASCGTSAYDMTATRYGNYVSEAVARIKQNIPKVIVNLMGTFRVSPVYDLTSGTSYCPRVAGVPTNRFLCSCFQSTSSARRAMDALSDAYDVKLREIYERYKGVDTHTFGVAYQPNNINIAGFPIEMMSTADCFHPSLISHQWIAKTHWNNLFTPQSYKASVHNYDANLQIYCPTESDRIVI